jgi:hypothetical protein
MAYKTKYKVGFYDFYNDYYELWIKKRDFEDLPKFIKAGPNPCTISMLGAGDNIFETVKGQELVLEIISEIDYEFEEFFTTSDREYVVELHPGKDTAVGAMSLLTIDSGATADPTFGFEFTEYGAATGLKPKALFNITALLAATNTQTIRCYQGRIDSNNNLIKTLISETLNIVLADYTPTTLAQLIIDNISNPDFAETPLEGGPARTFSAVSEFDSSGFPIAYTKLIVETSDKIQHYNTDFTLGLESPRFSILIGPQRFKKINGNNISWFDYQSEQFIAIENETIPQLCDRIVAAVDNTPAGIYGPSPSQVTALLLDIEPPVWTIRALHDGIGNLTFTLQDGGSDYNGTTFSIDSSNSPGFQEPGGFYTNPYIGYFTQIFSGGTSNAVTYKIEVDTGTGWNELVTYIKADGNDIFDIIRGLVNLINATTYSAIIDTAEPRRIIITPPPPQTGIGWKLRWVFSGIATGISEDFSPVNTNIILWKGFIIPGLYNEPHKQPPYMVGLRATDGLGDLKDIDFVDAVGEEITGNISLLDVIAVCLSKTNLNFDIAERMNLYEDGFLQQNSDSSLAQTYIDAILLKNQTCEFVLKKILEEFTSRVFQYNGIWLIERLPELDTPQNQRLFDRNGVYKSVSSKYNEIIIAGVSGVNHILDGTGNLEVDNAFREVRTKHDYGLKTQLLKNSSFDNGLDGQWDKTSKARYLFAGEHYGYASVLQDLGDAYNEPSNPNHDLQWFQQQFELETTPDHKYRITGKYLLFDPNGFWIPGFLKVKILVGLNINDVPFQPYSANEDGEWIEGEIPIELKTKAGQWLTFDIILDSLPVSGKITFRIYMMHISGAISDIWIGWDYATFEIVADLQSGEYVALRYKNSYQDYNGIHEIDMIASDVPSVPSRDTIYSAVLKNSDNNALRFWDNGRTLTSIARNAMFKQLGTYGQRLTTDILSQNYDFSTIVKDSLNDDKVFLLNGCSWSLKKGVFSGEWIQISKPLLNEPTEELFLPFEERKQGSQTYNPNPGGGGSTIVTLPADLLRETDVIDNLLSNSYLKPLSANQGRNLFAKILGNSDDKQIPYTNPDGDAFLFTDDLRYNAAQKWFNVGGGGSTYSQMQPDGFALIKGADIALFFSTNSISSVPQNTINAVNNITTGSILEIQYKNTAKSKIDKNGVYINIAGLWDDMRFPVVAINPPGQGSDPTYDVNELGYLFSANGTETLHIIAQMPHTYKEGSDIRPHVHWEPTNVNINNVVWRFSYRWRNNGETIGAWIDVDIQAAAAGIADTLQVNTFGSITKVDAKISSMLDIKLSRIGGDANDTYNADARLKEFDIHFQKNTNGSFLETIK